MAMPTTTEWQTMVEMAGVLIKSNMLPGGIRTQEQAVAVILKGHELGLQPMQSFALIHVISGKPTASSEFMLGLLARGGVTWNWIEKGDNGKAIIEFRREGFEPVCGTFTKEEAQQARLTGKDTWKNYPANMLRARAVANGARMIGPDLLMGMSYTPEEMGADVDENEDPTGPIGPSGPSQTPPDDPPAGNPDQTNAPLPLEPPDAGEPTPADRAKAKAEFVNRSEGIIAKIDDKDVVAIVLATCGYDTLDQVKPEDCRRVFYALKDKCAEIEEKRIVEEDVKAATKMAADL